METLLRQSMQQAFGMSLFFGIVELMETLHYGETYLDYRSPVAILRNSGINGNIDIIRPIVSSRGVAILRNSGINGNSSCKSSSISFPWSLFFGIVELMETRLLTSLCVAKSVAILRNSGINGNQLFLVIYSINDHFVAILRNSGINGNRIGEPTASPTASVAILRNSGINGNLLIEQ
ncbi:hypothetical protein L8106_13775 [Lyngbya sp. PCC 8106]|nr:hypothetical protein L8106_13775 [Lyngbya sp. PCC 8106]